MRERRYFKTIFGLLFGSALLMGCAGQNGVRTEELVGKTEEEINVGSLAKMASVHDPSIVKGKDDVYYIFGTHMSAAKSEDLVHWKSFADGVKIDNKLFSNLFTEGLPVFEFVGENSEGWYSVWAPDVIFNKAMNKYVMYFCTSSTYICSTICMATSDTIEGPYEYQETLLYSGFIKSTIQKTNLLDYVEKDTINTYAQSGLGYQNQYWPNCIDPTVFYDAEDRMWMVYGSWSGGIFLLELDETTGLPIHPEADEKNQVDPYFGKRLLGGYHQSIEGPYIMYDKETEYYYLFVSYGSLNSEGGYQIRLFRSKQVDGPYVDAKGSSMTMVDATNPEYNKEYGIKMMGNYNLPSLEVAYMAPGHNSAFIDADGKKYLVYHTRFDDGTEFHQPRVHQLFTNQSGWLVAAPFETNGETLKKEGYQKEEISGKYYIINHGTDISKKIPDTELYHFYSNGDITAKDQEGNNKLIGKWSIEEQTSYITVTLNDVVYEGVMIEMLDEAGNQVKCISAVSNNNETIWGVCYV